MPIKNRRERGSVHTTAERLQSAKTSKAQHRREHASHTAAGGAVLKWSWIRCEWVTAGGFQKLGRILHIRPMRSLMVLGGLSPLVRTPDSGEGITPRLLPGDA
jgi:hypothetical protein